MILLKTCRVGILINAMLMCTTAPEVAIPGAAAAKQQIATPIAHNREVTVSAHFDMLMSQADAANFEMGVTDFGSLVKYCLAVTDPQWVAALIVKNEDGLKKFWSPIKVYWPINSATNREALRPMFARKTTISQSKDAVSEESRKSPDIWQRDQSLLMRGENQYEHLTRFHENGRNVPLPPEFQTPLQGRNPSTLIFRGQNNKFCPADSAAHNLCNLPDTEPLLIETGHFAAKTQWAKYYAIPVTFSTEYCPPTKRASFESNPVGVYHASSLL